MSETEANEKAAVRDRLLWGLSSAGLLILAIGVGHYARLVTKWTSDDFRVYQAPVWGTLGDAVAPITALLSALAVFTAVISVTMQRKEMDLQREELQAQREQLRLQLEEMRESKQELKAHTAAADRLALAQEDANRLAREQLAHEPVRQFLAVRQAVASAYTSRSAVDHYGGGVKEAAGVNPGQEWKVSAATLERLSAVFRESVDRDLSASPK